MWFLSSVLYTTPTRPRPISVCILVSPVAVFLITVRPRRLRIRDIHVIYADSAAGELMLGSPPQCAAFHYIVIIMPSSIVRIPDPPTCIYMNKSLNHNSLSCEQL